MKTNTVGASKLTENTAQQYARNRTHQNGKNTRTKPLTNDLQVQWANELGKSRGDLFLFEERQTHINIESIMSQFKLVVEWKRFSKNYDLSLIGTNS